MKRGNIIKVDTRKMGDIEKDIIYHYKRKAYQRKSI